MVSGLSKWCWICAGLVIAAAGAVLEYTTVLPPIPPLPLILLSIVVATHIALVGTRQFFANFGVAYGCAILVALIGIGSAYAINRFIVDNIYFWPPGVK